MNRSRRIFLGLAAGAIAAPSVSRKGWAQNLGWAQNYPALIWHGLLVPAGVPQPVMQRLRGE